MELSIPGYSVSTDPSLLDLELIHQWLNTQSYWSRGISKDKLRISLAHSLNFGVYQEKQQVGFGRIISDFSSVAYLGDVFILEAHRGLGLSKLLLQTIMNHPHLQDLRRWILLTRDAHALYQQFGWKPIAEPFKWMEIHYPIPQ